MLPAEVQAAYEKGLLDVLLYADDTLLIGFDEGHVQKLLNAIADTGAKFGMQLHWSKFQMMQINHTYNLRTPAGDAIPAKDLMSYLGISVYADGGMKSELNQKLGNAWADFCKLNRLWKRTALPTAKKIRIFNAVVTPRLMYGLSSAWLNIAEMRRLNGFHCRCLRVLLRIAPSYISRVSNKTVLSQAQQAPLGASLLQQQLLYYGRIARAPMDDPLRKLTFHPQTTVPVNMVYVRRIGRPRNEWTTMLRKECNKISTHSNQLIRSFPEWAKAVHDHCFTRIRSCPRAFGV